MIYSPNKPASTRAQGRVEVGCEFFARYLRKLARFSGYSGPRPPEEEKRIREISISLIPNHPCSDLDFSAVGDLFSFSLGRAWAQALKNPPNHLSLRAKTRARAHARLGREFDAGLQKT